MKVHILSLATLDFLSFGLPENYQRARANGLCPSIGTEQMRNSEPDHPQAVTKLSAVFAATVRFITVFFGSLITLILLLVVGRAGRIL